MRPVPGSEGVHAPVGVRVAFTDPVIWGRDHKCRAIRPVPVLEPGDVLARVF